MPNDLWSYRGVFFRGFLAIPLYIACFVSNSFQEKHREKIDAFVWGYKLD